MYVCDEGTGYPETLVVGVAADGVTLVGGYNCTTWKRAEGDRSKVNPATGVPLLVQGLVQGVTVENFEFASADAAAGASSIAVRVENAANVVLRGSKLSAGKGGAGAAGVDGAKGDDGALVDAPQRDAAALCPSMSAIPLQAGGAWAGLSRAGRKAEVVDPHRKARMVFRVPRGSSHECDAPER